MAEKHPNRTKVRTCSQKSKTRSQRHFRSICSGEAWAQKMIRLRTFILLACLTVVAIALLASSIQMKKILERGARTLETQKIEHITQVVRAAVETKKSELRNYIHMI